MGANTMGFWLYQSPTESDYPGETAYMSVSLLSDLLIERKWTFIKVKGGEHLELGF